MTLVRQRPLYALMKLVRWRAGARVESPETLVRLVRWGRRACSDGRALEGSLRGLRGGVGVGWRGEWVERVETRKPRYFTYLGSYIIY